MIADIFGLLDADAMRDVCCECCEEIDGLFFRVIGCQPNGAELRRR